MALFNFHPLQLPSKITNNILEKFFRQIISHVPRIATYQVKIDLPSFTGGEVKHYTVTIPGLTLEDIIYANSSDLGDIHLICARVTATDTAEFTFWNDHGAVDPPEKTFNVVAIRR